MRGCLSNTNSIPLGIRARVGLGFIIDNAIGGQLTAGDQSLWLSTTCMVNNALVNCSRIEVCITVGAGTPHQGNRGSVTLVEKLAILECTTQLCFVMLT